MEVNQIITLDVGSRIRVFQITGVYYGSEREEDLVGLECLDKHHGNNTGVEIREMLVPVDVVKMMLAEECKAFTHREEEARFKRERFGLGKEE